MHLRAGYPHSCSTEDMTEVQLFIGTQEVAFHKVKSLVHLAVNAGSQQLSGFQTRGYANTLQEVLHSVKWAT